MASGRRLVLVNESLQLSEAVANPLATFEDKGIFSFYAGPWLWKGILDCRMPLNWVFIRKVSGYCRGFDH